MTKDWYATFDEFYQKGPSDNYYVEGYAYPFEDANSVLHCWIETTDSIIDQETWAEEYIPVHRYSWEEIHSLFDLVNSEDYPLLLSNSYGPPRFTAAAIRQLQNDRTKRLTRVKSNLTRLLGIKGSIADSKNDTLNSEPIAPKRGPGRPKKYVWEDEIDSSNLEKIYYNLLSETMTVDFRSGATYEYYNVPLKRYRYLKRAPSKGKYFHKKIRFSYPYKRVKG